MSARKNPNPIKTQWLPNRGWWYGQFHERWYQPGIGCVRSCDHQHYGLWSPPMPPQVDGKTNNVTFKTNRIDQWKDTIQSFFGESKSCMLKRGSVIKVTFDIKGKTYLVKINFYKPGSMVLEGAKCTKFTEKYLGTLTSRLENENQPQQESLKYVKHDWLIILPWVLQ